MFVQHLVAQWDPDPVWGLRILLQYTPQATVPTLLLCSPHVAESWCAITNILLTSYNTVSSDHKILRHLWKIHRDASCGVLFSPIIFMPGKWEITSFLTVLYVFGFFLHPIWRLGDLSRALANSLPGQIAAYSYPEDLTLEVWLLCIPSILLPCHRTDIGLPHRFLLREVLSQKQYSKTLFRLGCRDGGMLGFTGFVIILSQEAAFRPYAAFYWSFWI